MWWKLAPTDARYSGKQKIAVESSAQQQKAGRKPSGVFTKKQARNGQKAANKRETADIAL